MKKFIIQFALASTTILWLVACTKDKGEVPEPAPFVSSNDTIVIPPALYAAQPITYSGTIKGIIQTKCNGCHNLGFISANFTTYNGLKAKIDNGSFKNRVFTLKDMPPSAPLSENELAKIQCWLDEGTPNN